MFRMIPGALQKGRRTGRCPKRAAARPRGVVKALDDRAELVVKRRPLACRLDAFDCPLEQLAPKLLLQIGDAAAQGLLGYEQALGGL